MPAPLQLIRWEGAGAFQAQSGFEIGIAAQAAGVIFSVDNRPVSVLVCPLMIAATCPARATAAYFYFYFGYKDRMPSPLRG
jgi:hypothetical protein